MLGMGALKQNLRITVEELRTILLLSAISNNNAMTSDDSDNRIGLIEQLELEISARMYSNDEIVNDENYIPHHLRGLSRNQPQRISFRTRSQLRSRLAERNAVIVIHSDSDTESEFESEPVSTGCPRSVSVRMRRVLEPQLREQIRHEMVPQLREQIRQEMVSQLRVQIRNELEPQLRIQIHSELEPRLREQIRREILPTRFNIEDDIRQADEHSAWVSFLLYSMDDYEIDDTLDRAIAICEVCITPCMNRRPITLNCGHVFCGNCIREWCYVNRVCPKCRTQIRFSRSVFRAYPTLDII